VLRQRIGEINRGESELQTLQQAADADRVVYQTLLAKLNDTSNGFGLAPADVRITAMAAPAVTPAFPKKGLFTAVGFALSGALGLGLGLLRDHRQRVGFVSSSEVEHEVGLPVGAMIPSVRLAEPAEGILKRPRSAYAEAVRGVWPALGFSDDPSARAVMITSSVPDEGKSTFAVSLADALTAGGRRIAIIDLDLRRAGLTKKLKLEQAGGIVQFLARPTPASEFTLSCRPGVDVIPAGHGRDETQELLSAVQTRAKLRALVNDLKQTHDLVLIDSPPTLAVSDAAWLARLTDGVIYVVRWRQTPRAAVTAGLNQLHVVGATLLGVVMTQVDLRRHSTYGSGDVAHFHRLHRRYYAG
jgi:capsular exopolysaccharide synthesis family protein